MEVVAYFAIGHNIELIQDTDKVPIFLTDFIKPLMGKPPAQGICLEPRKLLLCPPYFESVPSMYKPPIFLVKVKVDLPKELLVWNCFQICGVEKQHLANFTLIREHTDSAKVIEGAKPCIWAKKQVTTEQILWYSMFGYNILTLNYLIIRFYRRTSRLGPRTWLLCVSQIGTTKEIPTFMDQTFLCRYSNPSSPKHPRLK